MISNEHTTIYFPKKIFKNKKNKMIKVDRTVFVIREITTNRYIYAPYNECYMVVNPEAATFFPDLNWAERGLQKTLERMAGPNLPYRFEIVETNITLTESV